MTKRHFAKGLGRNRKIGSSHRICSLMLVKNHVLICRWNKVCGSETRSSHIGSSFILTLLELQQSLAPITLSGQYLQGTAPSFNPFMESCIGLSWILARRIALTLRSCGQRMRQQYRIGQRSACRMHASTMYYALRGCTRPCRLRE